MSMLRSATCFFNSMTAADFSASMASLAEATILSYSALAFSLASSMIRSLVSRASFMSASLSARASLKSSSLLDCSLVSSCLAFSAALRASSMESSRLRMDAKMGRHAVLARMMPTMTNANVVQNTVPQLTDKISIFFQLACGENGLRPTVGGRSSKIKVPSKDKRSPRKEQHPLRELPQRSCLPGCHRWIQVDERWIPELKYRFYRYPILHRSQRYPHRFRPNRIRMLHRLLAKEQ